MFRLYFSAISSVPVPTLGSHQLLIFFTQIATLLLAALLLGSLARRFNIPVLVGELCAGVILGPSVFGHVSPRLFHWLLPQTAGQYHLLDAVGQVGVLLLVGLSGIELNIAPLRHRRATVTRIALPAACIPFLAGFIVGYYMLPSSFMRPHTDRLLLALFIGITMSVSALPVMAKLLMDASLLRHKVGQLSLAAGSINDIFGWLMLSIVSAMIATGHARAGKALESLLIVCALLVLSWFVGRRIVHKILALTRSNADDGPTVTAMVAMIMAYAAITQALGLEAVFGALICGILIGSDPKFHKIRLPTVLSVLAPLFFATAGLRINLSELAHPTVLLVSLGMLAVATLSKYIGVYLGSALSGLKHWESVAIGAAMNARGIIEIVIASIGLQIGILSVSAYTAIILIALATSIMAAPILRLSLVRLEAAKGQS